MWFDGVRKENTIYVANVSRGKDSTAMLRAIQLMGWPLDMICAIDVWFDNNTPAELPPMVRFKDEYDRKCYENFGVPVTRLCAMQRSQNGKVERESKVHDDRTPECSIISRREESTSGLSKVSQKQTDHGASISRKLTYADIFYRRITPQRERERESCVAAA